MSTNSPQHIALSLLTNGCKSLKTAQQLHAYLTKTALDTHPFFTGKLILHCTSTISDAIDYARSLFTHFPSPDIFMHNTLIRGLSESDTPHNAVHMFVEMRQIMLPDSFSFAFVLKAAANLKCLNVGVQLHSQALRHGLDTHLFVGTTLISMYGECGCVYSAKKVFDEMCEPNVVAQNSALTACFRSGDVMEAGRMFGNMPFKNSTSWNVMLSGYMKAGEVDLAKKAFFDMPVKDDVSWSTMIAGFAQNGCFGDALWFFRELQRVGMRPNEVSLTGALSACSQAGAFEFAKNLHGFIEKSGFSWIVAVNNALIDTYSRCGNVGMARLIFERMGDKSSIVSWTSMIAGFAMHGQGEDAIRLFEEMEALGIKPDGITFISMLYACSHAGLISEGYKYYYRMKDLYGIEPAVEHYGCMVDLYGRAGKLQRAYEFIYQMPVPPNAIIWRTLLGACSIHGNVNLAEIVKEKLSELEPNNASDQVLLSNVYAIARKWKDVASVRRSMTNQRIVKDPGWSLIEVDKVVYSFVAGLNQDSVAIEACEKLREIMRKLRVEGSYVPEIRSVLHDIEEEEKEDSVTMHSEKLAVAFGISRLLEGKPVRIFKNLRICRDCHTMMKLVSTVYRREIIVRDRSRFHIFKNGNCSCKDYW